jgi:hypothetical protein
MFAELTIILIGRETPASDEWAHAMRLATQEDQPGSRAPDGDR